MPFPSGAVLYFLAQGEVVYQGKQSEWTDEAPFSIDDHLMEGISVGNEEYRIAMKF